MNTPTPAPGHTPITPEISTPRTGVTGQFEAIRTTTTAPETNTTQLLAIRERLAQESEHVNARLRGIPVTLEQAAQILGPKLFLDHTSTNKLYGTRLTPEIVAQIPFSLTEGEANNALRLKTPVSLHVKEFSHGESAKPSTMLNLNDHVADTQRREALCDTSWYKNEDFAENAADKLEWRQTTPDVVPGTLGKDFLERTDLQIRYLREEFYKGLPLPATYEKAIQEWNTERPNIEPLVQNWNGDHASGQKNWYVAAEMLEKLQIVQLLRPTPTSIMQDIANMKSVGVNMLEGSYTDTSVRSSVGSFVRVGLADSGGVIVYSDGPFRRYDDLGSSISRSLSE